MTNVANSDSGIMPLFWKLCTTGDEKPGTATGSLILDIGYGIVYYKY
jgi:hypothetical protein